MTILLIIIACILSAILYRAGGMGQEDTAEPKWIPKWLRKSWVRDWLCPACLLLALCLYLQLSSWQSWVGLLLYYGLSGAALSTYWDFLFGYDNYYMHGLGCGVAGFLLILCGIPWWILLIRLIICPLGMGIWSKINTVHDDVHDEMGRGVFFIL